MIVLGIDPGKTGAMVILYDLAPVAVCRVPLAGKEPAWGQWAREWCMAIDINRPDMAAIENVGSRPKQGVSSVFKFGESLGFVHGLVQATASIPIHWPTPAVWKRYFSISADKGEAREEARRLMPALAPEITRVKDDGVAEAALMAYWCAKVHGA